MKNRAGIYVHIPFCVNKCSYCDFFSIKPKENEIEKYFNSLKEEIRSSRSDENIVDTIFFGGGTPSFVPDKELILVLKEIYSSFIVDKNAEITIEANPNSLTEEKLFRYKEAGFNRLSIGLQSANKEELKILERSHTVYDFQNAVEKARKVGFKNINVDIMLALPYQNLEKVKKTLDFVTNFNIEHISAYSLIIEENTKLFYMMDNIYKNTLPDEEVERQIYYFVRDYLEKKGYVQYEISNFAKKEDRKIYACKHNLGYWQMKNYYGFGVAASGFILPKRYTNTKDLKQYLNANNFKERVDFEENLSKRELESEFMFLGLRCINGISKEKFRSLFNEDMDEIFKEAIEKNIKDKLLKKTDIGYSLTRRGIDISNYVLADFL